MSDKVLERYTARRSDVTSGEEAPERTDDFGAFGMVRGLTQRCVMIEFRKRGGDVLALASAYVERIESVPSEGITIAGAGMRVKIRGQNLHAEVRPGVTLLSALTRQKVAWVREADRAEAMEGDGGAIVIERIEW